MRGPSRLMIVSQDYPPEHGGIQGWSHEMARQLGKLCEVTTLAPAQRGGARFDSRQGYRTLRVWTPHTSIFGTVGGPAIAALALRTGCRTVLHAQYGSAPGSYLARKAGLVDHYFVAAHGRELVREHLGAPQRAWRREILRQATCVFAVSRYTAGLARRLGIAEERVEVVNNGVDLETFGELPRRDCLERLGLRDLEKRKILLTTARLVQRKGVDDAIEAFGRLSERHPEWVYLVVGDGPEEKRLRTMRPDLIESRRVRFVGRVPFDHLPRYHNVADLFVMPSREEAGGDVEGFGLVFLEAGACGTAVLGARSGGIEDAVGHGENGLLVEPGNVDELCARMGELFEDRRLRESLARGGLERSREFTWERAARKVFEVMGERMARKPKGRG